MDEAFLKSAHQHSFQSRKEIEKSGIAGCFYCKEIYPAKEIEEWIPDKEGDTAMCPKCGIDSVIGDASGIPISKEFLEAMHERWFGRTKPLDQFMNNTLSAKYQGKILGIRLYDSGQKEFLVSDFMNKETLAMFLGEVWCDEADLTPAGKAFLERFYGWDELAKILIESQEFLKATNLNTLEGIKSYFINRIPMEVALFIEESRGTIKPGAKLKPQLLPPEED